jgi:hypothetical protein
MTGRVPEFQEKADVSVGEQTLMKFGSKVTSTVQRLGGRREASKQGPEDSKPQRADEDKKEELVSVPQSAQSENTVGKEEPASSQDEAPRPPETKEQERSAVEVGTNSETRMFRCALFAEVFSR